MTDKEIEKKFIERDPSLLSLVYAQFANAALNFFRKEYPSIDKQLIQDVICDSLIALSLNPEKYKPEKKASLKTYIFKDIKGNILNELEKVKRPRYQFNQNTVELDAISGNNNTELAFTEVMELKELKGQINNFLSSIFLNERDRRLAWMIAIDRERKTEEFSDVLELSNISPNEWANEVKKHKDRITIQLKRKGWDEFIKKLRNDG